MREPCAKEVTPPRSNLHALGRRLLALLRRAAAKAGGSKVEAYHSYWFGSPPSNDTNFNIFAQVDPFQSIGSRAALGPPGVFTGAEVSFGPGGKHDFIILCDISMD